ncbi:MAG: hypothetical protein ACI853_001332 [Paracoccaceae bacterium]|jgi:hypothetical protein
MSYAVSAALQKGIFGVLSADPVIASSVGSAIFDATPAGSVPGLYISLGPEEASARNDKSCDGALHRFVVSVVSDAAGFQTAKEVAVAVSDALHGAIPALERGRIVSLNFERAKASRIGPDEKRQIDLRFAARVEDN